MTGRRVLWSVVAGALLAMTGIVGMLLSDGAWDGCFLFMAAAPLLVGAAVRISRSG